MRAVRSMKFEKLGQAVTTLSYGVTSLCLCHSQETDGSVSLPLCCDAQSIRFCQSAVVL